MPCGCNKGASNGANSVNSFQSSSFQIPERTVEAPGTQYPDYVLARFLPESGVPYPPSGREYPFMLRDEIWWVHPDDVAVRPKWWSLEHVAEPA